MPYHLRNLTLRTQSTQTHFWIFLCEFTLRMQSSESIAAKPTNS